MEEAAAQWTQETDFLPDEVVTTATTSMSASNPWLFYESGLVCVKSDEAELLKNSSGQKVINLREWDKLHVNQRICLRRQSIRRPEWEKLPWTGHMCFLLTRAWELGRWKSHHMRMFDFDQMSSLTERAKYWKADWMRGATEPRSWKDRFTIPKDDWPERWMLYKRDEAIQADLEFIAEAVYQFYQVHLDKMIRKNNLLWGDFCRKKLVRNSTTGVMEDTGFLDLDTEGYDMTNSGVEVLLNEKTVIPEPERHFSFSTTLMVMAIELYQREVPDKKFCHYTSFAYRKLIEFVESRIEFTKESYRFFVEHAYNQFFQHESFHSSACSKTTARDLETVGELPTSTKLQGYTWVASDDRITRVPTDLVSNFEMHDYDQDADEAKDDAEKEDDLPLLQVRIQPPEEERPDDDPPQNDEPTEESSM